MRIIIAPQEYKGTLSAREAAEALAAGARHAAPAAQIELIPLSDGGPGLIDAVLASLPGRLLRTRVEDPLGRPVEAAWALLDDGSAVIEMAAAAGLILLAEEERDPRIASTYGVGQLLRAALDAGCRSLIVGAGGSATNDGGAGMASALGARFLDGEDRELPPGGAPLSRLRHIDTGRLDERLAGCRIVAATDVVNPLCGPEGASLVYGPQKGASPDIAGGLDAALRRYGEIIERDLRVVVLDVPGAGAAGGLGAGLIAFCRAEVCPGFDVVAAATRLPERLPGAHLVLTGEGRLDGQTAFGKTIARLARLARGSGVPLIAIPGSLGAGWQSVLELVDRVEPTSAGDGTDPSAALAAAAQRAVAAWLAADSRQP